MKPRFFGTPVAFRQWLKKHHASSEELWVGYYKKHTGRPSMTWPESVDQALCFGWIDGLRKSIDNVSYAIRFTPRRAGSTWSRVNIRRARALIKQGEMRRAGLKAYQARRSDHSAVSSYRRRPMEPAEPYKRLLKQNRAAWNFFRAQAPYYRRTVSWWIVSAKKEQTRLKRLEKLVAHSLQGQKLPEMRRVSP